MLVRTALSVKRGRVREWSLEAPHLRIVAVSDLGFLVVNHICEFINLFSFKTISKHLPNQTVGQKHQTGTEYKGYDTKRDTHSMVLSAFCVSVCFKLCSVYWINPTRISSRYNSDVNRRVFINITITKGGKGDTWWTQKSQIHWGHMLGTHFKFSSVSPQWDTYWFWHTHTLP